MKGVRFAGDVDPKSIQTLARHEMMARLLADIAADMTVCRLEGWDVFEYPRMVRAEMDGIIRRAEPVQKNRLDANVARNRTISDMERAKNGTSTQGDETMARWGETPEGARTDAMERIASALERIAECMEKSMEWEDEE